MADTPRDRDHRELHRAVKARERSHRRWEEEGERPLWRNLSMIGSLGWLIVTPALLGIVAGRWLDRVFDAGIFWSGMLLFAGIVFGCWLAWKKMHAP